MKIPGNLQDKSQKQGRIQDSFWWGEGVTIGFFSGSGWIYKKKIINRPRFGYICFCWFLRIGKISRGGGG